jgi:hypothetical protein
MAKERKSASARLSDLLESSRENPFLRIPFDWSDPGVWAVAARKALNLDSASNDANKSLRLAFDEFQLDWHNPYHWRQLLEYYVLAHVRRGRPREWTNESLCILLRNISKTREQNPSLKRRAEIYDVLVKRRAPYAGKEKDYLKYAHKIALDPRYNEILCMHRDAFVEEAMAVIRLSYEEKGIRNVPPAIEDKIHDIALDHALESIGAPLGKK